MLPKRFKIHHFITTPNNLLSHLAIAKLYSHVLPVENKCSDRSHGRVTLENYYYTQTDQPSSRPKDGPTNQPTGQPTDGQTKRLCSHYNIT